MTSYLLLTLDTLVFFPFLMSSEKFQSLTEIPCRPLPLPLSIHLLFMDVSGAFLSFFYPTIVRDTIAWSTLLLLSLLVAEERECQVVTGVSVVIERWDAVD